MSTIVVANRKGGSGKTTLTLILADRILDAGGKVALLEGDPNSPLLGWARGRDDCATIDVKKLFEERRPTLEEAKAAVEAHGAGKRCIVITDTSERSVTRWLEAVTGFGQFVICDPEGSPNSWMVSAISQADLVLIPFAPTALDAKQVARTIEDVQELMESVGRDIPFWTVLTKTNPIPTKDERIIREKIAGGGVPMLATYLQDRPAFRAVFRLESLLNELDPAEVNGLEKAKTNAAQLANEVIQLLRSFKEKAA